MSRPNFIIGLLSVFAVFFAQSSWSQCDLTTSWEPWEPYQFESGDKVTGLDTDLVLAIAEKAGCSVKYTKRPWARALREIEAGDLDFASGASINEERKKFANFSIPYRDETMVLMVRKGESGNYKLNSVEDISQLNFKLGVVRDYYYGEAHKAGLEKADYKAKIQEVSNDSINLKKLVAKRIDGLLIDKYAGPYMAKQEGVFDQIEVHPLKVSSDDIYLMFSKKSVSADTIEKINGGLKKLKDSGGYQEIINKYLN